MITREQCPTLLHYPTQKQAQKGLFEVTAPKTREHKQRIFLNYKVVKCWHCFGWHWIAYDKDTA